ncbi:ADP-ribosylglycohydrolase family protein [Georgenia sp. TF02-10]|uniref:ADP-ribosylglycohydrolase family protein n=1 Tax=Georgenia sp. TF02-10 TaxID=2917725 RepID=UPI001FA7FCAE|nr:ADP-ribosylglycohydrolase family protein [Georgenia sp. TF02-10]UNX54829.1 ADP-ribosylglycohydrolase family protein [Georgenia sp. TF02-10]
MTTSERTRSALAGMCAGDAAAWSSWWHRLGVLPPRRSVRLGEAVRHSHALGSTSLPTPYLQSTPPDVIDPAGPADDVEWFVVSLRHHLGQRLDGAPAGEEHSVWTELSGQHAREPGTVRARLGTLMALENLAAGMTPPQSGNDNAHYFDDIACVRAVAAAVLRPGDPRGAADLADADARITHALDGVDGARATAALLAVLLGGGDRADAVDVAVRELPPGGWCANVVAECLAVGPAAPLPLAARLERDVVDHVYAFANQAPETLGLLLAHLAAARTGEELLLGAFAHPRHADALVPLAGTVAGAAFGDPSAGADLPVLTGTSVRALAGLAVEDVLGEIDAAQAGRSADRSAVVGEGR